MQVQETGQVSHPTHVHSFVACGRTWLPHAPANNRRFSPIQMVYTQSHTLGCPVWVLFFSYLFARLVSICIRGVCSCVLGKRILLSSWALLPKSCSQLLSFHKYFGSISFLADTARGLELCPLHRSGSITSKWSPFVWQHTFPVCKECLHASSLSPQGLGADLWSSPGYHS